MDLQAILTNADAHAAARVAEHTVAVDAVRAELHDAYLQATEHARFSAKAIEAAAPEYQDFLASVNTILAKEDTCPDSIRTWVGEIHQTLAGVAVQIREGISAYNNVTFENIAGGVEHAAFVGRVRDLLRAGDGVLARLEMTRGLIEHALREWLSTSRTI